MSFNFRYIIDKRQAVFVFLIIITFISFILSYAVSNIAQFLFILFFFIDSKKNIILKLAEIKKNKLVIAYFLFFLVQVIGYFYSIDKIVAKRQIEIMIPVLFLPAILSVEKLNETNFNRILSFLKYAILLIFSCYLFIHVVIDHQIINTFVHFTINKKIGISQVFIAFILLIPLLESIRQLETNKNLLLNALLLSISVGFIFLLGNKTTLIFLVVLVLLLIKKLNKTNPKLRLFFIIFFLIASYAAYQTPIVKNRINIILKTTDFDLKTIITKNKFTQTKNTFEHRILINHLALKEIKKALPFGVGTGDFQEKLNKQYQRIQFKAGIKEALNNHNQYLSEFLKTGILGGFLFILIMLLLLKSSLGFTHFTFPIILLFVVGSFIESYLSRQHGVSIFAFIIPFFLNHKEY